MKEPLAIGIVGGMSPESTVTYYQHIVRRHQQQRGDHRYPRIVIASVSFQQYIDWQHEGRWEEIAGALQEEFAAVAAAGADFAVLATNTMHKVLPRLRSPIPILAITDAVAAHARENGIATVALTGTKFTMSDGFYARALESSGIGVLLPSERDQSEIHRIIYDELIGGRVESSSVAAFAAICRRLAAGGAEAILLACTELELLMRGAPLPVRAIDTTAVHADAAWSAAMRGRD